MSSSDREFMTLADLVWAAPGTQTAVVVPEQGTRITYEALRAHIETVASALIAAGVNRTDRVGIALPNGLPMTVCVLAAAIAGTAAPLNPAYTEDEFRFYLADSGARALIVPRSGAPAAQRAAGHSVRLLIADADSAGRVFIAGQHDKRPLPTRAPSDVALILHTSGSTGTPKRVSLSHANLSTSARNVARTYSLASDDVALCVMPLFHVHGLVATLLATFAAGAVAVVPSRFNAMSFWQVVREHHATWYSAVPTLHQLLLKREGVRRNSSNRHTLRFIRSCSAALAPSVMTELEHAFGTPVIEAYGMTEAAHQIASNPLPPGIRKPGSVGRGTAVRISVVDVSGRHLKQDECGEVVIQGANVITGYDGNPEANESAFVGGWFRTGDLGRLDGDHCLTLVGRIKELINRGGEKIAPREVDEVLLSHPAVAEAVCFGRPDPIWGEEVSAAVVLVRPALESQLLTFCHSHLAAHKCPTRIHLVEAIPRSATGKIQRRTLAQHYTGAS
jgi:acyl-CoA synthetase (AMP-forming)/AMP-acid ligase II